MSQPPDESSSPPPDESPPPPPPPPPEIPKDPGYETRDADKGETKSVIERVVDGLRERGKNRGTDQ